MSKERCCGTCGHSLYGEEGYVCVCTYGEYDDAYEGDHYSDYVEHDFSCEDWSKKE